MIAHKSSVDSTNDMLVVTGTSSSNYFGVLKIPIASPHTPSTKIYYSSATNIAIKGVYIASAT